MEGRIAERRGPVPDTIDMTHRAAGATATGREVPTIPRGNLRDAVKSSATGTGRAGTRRVHRGTQSPEAISQYRSEKMRAALAQHQ
jgi:hypothetical protein